MYIQWHRKQFLNGGGSSVLNEKSMAIYMEQLDKSSLAYIEDGGAPALGAPHLPIRH